MKKKKGDGGGGGGGANWMDSWTDMLSLLLCFFVLLFASSTISESRWAELVEAFTGAPPGAYIEAIDVANPMSGGITSASGISARQRPEEEEEEEESDGISTEEQALQLAIDDKINALYAMLSNYIDEQGKGQVLMLERDGMYINLTVAEGILFDSGNAVIRDEEAEEILTAVGDMLKIYLDSISNIVIEGHTDSDPVRSVSSGITDNLDLSSARANNVARFMSEACGIDMSMFRSLGLSEWEPIAPNDTPENKQKNRRVRIVVVAKDAKEVLLMAEEAGGYIDVSTEVTISTADE